MRGVLKVADLLLDCIDLFIIVLDYILKLLLLSFDVWTGAHLRMTQFAVVALELNGLND